MKRWISFLGHLVIIVVLTSFSVNTAKDNIEKLSNAVLVTDNYEVLFPKIYSKDNTKPKTAIFLGKGFKGFKEAIAFKESQGDYKAVNTLGYIGKYQFGANTLKLLGVHNTDKFLNDPVLQENVFELNVSRNKWILRKDIKRFVGKQINGTIISESGIIAAAHLAGAGNVKKYLRSYGKHDSSDAYGSSIAYYMKKFKGYDVSSIKTIHNPKV